MAVACAYPCACVVKFCIFLAAVFACLMAGDVDAFWKARTYFFGAAGLSGFFAYEVCRKLDPLLPKVS